MKNYICTSCGFSGKPQKKVKGSIIIELALWLLLIVPGIIYSIWRLTSGFSACPKCGNATMIPIDTPLGQKLIKEMSKSQRNNPGLNQEIKSEKNIFKKIAKSMFEEYKE